MINDVVICSPLRTPVGGFGGQFASLTAPQLATQLLEALLAKSALDPERIDDVILGHGYPTMEAPAIGRVVALDAGLPIRVAGRQVDRRCASGLQAILDAAGQIATGGASLVVAGGVESMSGAGFFVDGIRWGSVNGTVDMKDSLQRGRVTAGGKNHVIPGGMIETAENLRREYAISREEQDQLAVESHRRATRAQQAGHFMEEIAPVTVPGTRKVAEHQIHTDEHIRPDSTLVKLAKLSPILKSTDPESTVTAGNASGQNDGAAMCIVTTMREAERNGLTPLVRLVSWGVSGVAPETMGIGPVPATKYALNRANLALPDMDLIELNEAFAAQVLAVTREWGFPAFSETTSAFDRLNVNGSGISLGHPIGATGARILTTLAYEMHRREARYGLETMCVGGGQGLAAIFERIV